MYNVWLYDIICIWVWLYIWLYDCMSTCVICDICDMMCCIMWDCKYGYTDVMCYVYGYTGYACTVCVIWYDDLRLIYTFDMILCYMCVMIVYMQIWACCMTGIFVYSFEYYILWIIYEHNMYDLCTLYGWIVNIYNSEWIVNIMYRLCIKYE